VRVVSVAAELSDERQVDAMIDEVMGIATVVTFVQ